MLIKRIPNFLLSPSEYSDYFAFDHNGRFCFCKKKEVKTKDIIFIVYDILFNDYVELTPNPSNPNIATEYKYECVWQEIHRYLPISIEQVLITVQSGETNVLLLLVHFDLHKKIYEILDYVNIEKCNHPEFVQDGESFGLFYQSTITGRYSDITNTDNSFFMLKYFTIQDNHIILGNDKRFNFTPLNTCDFPLDLYLRNNKLWYIRKKQGIIAPAPPPSLWHLHHEHYDPTKNNLQICYFDLEENFPSEIFVYELHIEDPDTNPIKILKWVQDSLLFLQFGTKFNVFNLLTLEWTPKALDSGTDFTNSDENGVWQENGTWIEYHCSKNENAEWAEYSAVHIDDEYVITAVNRKYAALHRIPLKVPLKLSMLAWCCALNVGLINENTSLPPKLSFSRVL